MGSTSSKLKFLGLLSLITTTILWGTSFAFIKLSMGEVDPYTYTFTRTALATLVLTPLVARRIANRSFDSLSFKRGFITGLAYTVGLCLQAAGTAYVDPSTSAFITGLSTIHVHLYAGFVAKRYTMLDLVSLALAITGLYALTTPAGGFGVGELLVFTATFAWATQILLIARFKGSSMYEFLLGCFTVGLLYAPLSILHNPQLSTEALVYIAYLALVCSIGATFFQVLGQRYVSPETAALVFLLEPVFALVFSVLMKLEELALYKVLGGGLILVALYVATVSEFKYKS
ncbi:MAG: DMT family transporter [Desulfurococcaceae archaeon]